jgi:hypothetical protein
MTRKRSPNQLDLFAAPAPETPARQGFPAQRCSSVAPAADSPELFASPDPLAPAPGRQCPPVRGRKPVRSSAGNPAVARDVLAEVHLGRYGLLDDTDRVVVFEDDHHVRMALDEDAIHNLITQGYVERRSTRDTVSCLHGAIRRPVLPLRLTKTGRTTLDRWSAYTPLGDAP